MIDQHAWTSRGPPDPVRDVRGRAGQRDVLLRRKGSTDQHVLPLERDGQRFSVTIDATAMPSFGRQLPLRDGSWELGAARGRGSQGDGEPITPAYDHARLAEVSDRRLTFGPKAYASPPAATTQPILTVGPASRSPRAAGCSARCCAASTTRCSSGAAARRGGVHQLEGQVVQ